MRPSGLICALISALIAVCFLANCSRGKTQETPPLPIGQPALVFDLEKTLSLTIAKADPVSGDRWMARVERDTAPMDTTKDAPKAGNTEKVFFPDDTWKIASYSENSGLIDRLANRNYILHLLDTLTTFRVTALVKSGELTHAELASYGLAPPRYALEWEDWDPAAKQTHLHQIQIGSPTDPGNPAMKESYALFPPSRILYKADGAAIAMLEYLKNFTMLRQETLSPLTSDDVEEIAIFAGTPTSSQARELFYAQRDGDTWADRKHRPWKKDVGGFLDRLTHLRILKFIDSDQEPAPLKTALAHSALRRIVLKDRYSRATTFRFARARDRALADVSSRGPAVFELYPDALNPLEPP